MSSVDPNRVRALVRQALEQKLGLGPTSGARPLSRPASVRVRPNDFGGSAEAFSEGGRERETGPSQLSVHPSQLAIAQGPAVSDCYEDMDLPLQKPCLIEPHRPCYNSGYCRKLGH